MNFGILLIIRLRFSKSAFLPTSSKVCGFTRVDYSKIAYEEPDQISTLIQAKKNAVDGYVKTLNNYVSQHAK